MRIGIVSDASLVNSNYRAYQPCMALSRCGHSLEVNRLGEPRFRIATLLNSDVVLVHRYVDREMRAVVEQLTRAGVGVVWDNDDDMTSIPRGNPNRGKHGGAIALRLTIDIAKMVGLAQVVTTPSRELAERFRASGATDVRVLENFLPPEFTQAKANSHDGVVLAWLAGLEHQVDYQQLRLKETLERLLDEHADLRVMSIGLGLGLKTDRYEHLPIVDFFDLANVLSRADFGIAPLVDIPWNRARSNIKLKEYASAGLTWLASPVGAYRTMGESEGGALVPDDGWYEAIGDLVTSARRRRKLGKRAAKWAKGQSIDRHAHLWADAFEDAIARVRPI